MTTGPINKQTQSFSLQVRIGSTCGVNIQGASVYVTAVPYNQFDIPAEKLTGSEQHHDCSASAACRTS